MIALEQRVNLLLVEAFALQFIFPHSQLNFSIYHREQCERFNSGKPRGGWKLIRNWGGGRYFAQLE